MVMVCCGRCRATAPSLTALVQRTTAFHPLRIVAGKEQIKKL
jgi:hypothetical protein